MEVAEQVRQLTIINYVYLAYEMYYRLFPIRRFWVREINRPSAVEGFFACTFAIAYEKDPGAFFGMTAGVFHVLLRKVAHKLIRKSIRTPLSPRLKNND